MSGLFYLDLDFFFISIKEMKLPYLDLDFFFISIKEMKLRKMIRIVFEEGEVQLVFPGPFTAFGNNSLAEISK